MKNIFGLIILIVFCSFTSKAQIVSDTFAVNGNCDICKKKIEMACYGLKGVKNANWNPEKLVLAIQYDSTKINKQAVLQRLALIGYDSEICVATEKAYNKLPECCHYDRTKVKSEPRLKD